MTLTLAPSGVELCFSHFSKDLIRPCLRGTKRVLALLINFLSLRQGEYPQGERVDKLHSPLTHSPLTIQQTSTH